MRKKLTAIPISCLLAGALGSTLAWLAEGLRTAMALANAIGPAIRMSDLLPLVLVPAALWLTLTDRLRGVIAGALFMLGIGIALQVRAVLWNYLFVASCLALSLIWLIRSYGAFVGRVTEAVYGGGIEQWEQDEGLGD
jgi:hypothetical protein